MFEYAIVKILCTKVAKHAEINEQMCRSQSSEITYYLLIIDEFRLRICIKSLSLIYYVCIKFSTKIFLFR